MKNIRGGTHTTLTETANLVVTVLEKIAGISLISPGIINRSSSKGGKRFVTAVFTNAGMELIISGQGVQKVAVHCSPKDTARIYSELSSHKKLSAFTFSTRDKKPGV
jgi:hypothetical protein